jgi:alanine dehydrogenase
MKVGVPSEIKTDEYRVALTPIGVRELAERGHEVMIQSGAGVGSAIADADYAAQGASILPDADAVFEEAEMIVKVKEPQPAEVARLSPHHTLFTYLHLAPDPELTRGLIDSGATCIAYETVTDPRGRLPLLAPMSEVAGKIATQAGAFMLEKPLGGRGVLMGGVPGRPRRQRARHRRRRGRHARRLHRDRHGGARHGLRPQPRPPARARHRLRRPRPDRLRHHARGRAAPARRGHVIGAVLVHGARAPYVIRREQLKLMKPGAVLVDVSIDQGGCFETSRATTHSDPTYEVDGITHYCVANMPGAVPVTSTYALTNATLPYVVDLADLGVSPPPRPIRGSPRASTWSAAGSPTRRWRRRRRRNTRRCSMRWGRPHAA